MTILVFRRSQALSETPDWRKPPLGSGRMWRIPDQEQESAMVFVETAADALKEVAVALTRRGVPCSAKTLSTRACRAGRPPYRRFAKRATYQKGEPRPFTWTVHPDRGMAAVRREHARVWPNRSVP